VRLGRGVRVDAEHPRRREDGARIVGAVGGDLAHDGDPAGLGLAGGAGGARHDQAHGAQRLRLGQRDEATTQRQDAPARARPKRIARDREEALAVVAALEHVVQGRPRDGVAAAGARARHARRVEAEHEPDAIDGRGLGEVDPQRPARAARSARPPARVGAVDGPGGVEAPEGAVVAGHPVAQHVARALEGLDLAHDGRPGVGAVDDQAQATRVGVDEPGAVRRLRPHLAGGTGIARRRLIGAVEGDPRGLAAGRRGPARDGAAGALGTLGGRSRLPVEHGGDAAGGRGAEGGPHHAEVHRPRERRDPAPLQLAGASRPGRVVATVDREARVVPRGIGRMHRAQIGRVQRVEQPAARVGDDERTRAGTTGVGQDDGERRREGHERQAVKRAERPDGAGTGRVWLGLGHGV
jgi:hypothetical protein